MITKIRLIRNIAIPDTEESPPLLHPFAEMTWPWPDEEFKPQVFEDNRLITEGTLQREHVDGLGYSDAHDVTWDRVQELFDYLVANGFAEDLSDG